MSSGVASRALRVGVCGLGFMGRTHLLAYASARRAGLPNEIVAVADRNPERCNGQFDTRGNIDAGSSGEALFDAERVAKYSDPLELVRADDIDLVSICTPTDSHVELARAALEAGKHVLVEKPVALEAESIAKLERVARTSPGLCMPGMCVRFWPGWSDLIEFVRDSRYGRCTSFVIRRLASKPDWSEHFYGDSARTGGALFDLHVHDVDFLHACFGAPRGVRSSGHLDHLATMFDYGPEGPGLVLAEGGWDHAPDFPFHMGFTAVFEHATLDFDSGRESPLFISDADGRREFPIAGESGYDLEVQALLRAIAGAGEPSKLPELADAARVTRVLNEISSQL